MRLATLLAYFTMESPADSDDGGIATEAFLRDETWPQGQSLLWL